MRWMLALFAATLGAAGLDWVGALGGAYELGSDGAVRALHLRQSFVADSDLDRVAQLASLEKLDLSLTRVTDLGLLRLKGLRNVRELNLYYAELVTDEGLATMRDWQKIERINARGTKVTDNTLAILAGKKSIVALDVGFAEVTDSGLQHLSSLTGLRELAFGGNKLTEVGLQVLRTLPQLRVLDLSGKQRTDSGLWFLGTTDVGLDPVATVSGLEELNLSGLNITGRGIEKLMPLAKLARLDLHGAKRIGDEAVPFLAQLPALKWVDVQDTSMTAGGIEELRRLRPGLRVDGQPRAVEMSQAEFENDYFRVERAARPGRGVSLRVGDSWFVVQVKQVSVNFRVPEAKLKVTEDRLVLLNEEKVRVLRIDCPGRGPCGATDQPKHPAITIDLNDASGQLGRVVFHPANAPVYYSEYPLPRELVRIEVSAEEE
jgi:hypothetical protein